MIEVLYDVGGVNYTPVEIIPWLDTMVDGTYGSSVDHRSETFVWAESRTSLSAAATYAAVEPLSFSDSRVDLLSGNAVEARSEYLPVAETRTSLLAYAPTAGVEAYTITEARTSIVAVASIRTEAYTVTESRVDTINLTGGLHSVDALSELLRLSGELPVALTPLQLAEITLEENPMPGNVVRMDTVLVSYTGSSRADVTQLTGRIRVRVTNNGSVPVFVGNSNAVSTSTGEQVDPQGGMWEQYWTEAVQVFLIAGGTGTNQSCIVTQTAVQ